MSDSEEQVAPPLYEEEEEDIFSGGCDHIMISGIYLQPNNDDDVADGATSTIFFKKIYRISEEDGDNVCRATHLRILYDELNRENTIELPKNAIKAAIAELTAEWNNKQLVLALKENRFGNRTDNLDVGSRIYIINNIELY